MKKTIAFILVAIIIASLIVTAVAYEPCDCGGHLIYTPRRWEDMPGYVIKYKNGVKYWVYREVRTVSINCNKCHNASQYFERRDKKWVKAPY